MNNTLCLAVSLLALNLAPVFGQPVANPPLPAPTRPLPPSPAPSFQQRLNALTLQANDAEAPALTKFNLDFPGGTPKELVAAIEKAMGKPLNVIIPEENADTKLPPVKVSDMDVSKLFRALSENGLKYADPGRPGAIVRNYGFKTIDDRPSDSSLWTFYSYTRPVQQTQFNLDFPGGTPAQLVKAIERSLHNINVIINKDDENVELPPLKMQNVYLPQLFTALEVASRKPVVVPGAGYPGSYQQFTTSYGFKSADDMSDTAVWYFHVDKPSLPPVASTQKISQFYSLAPYLDRGFTVDDITTAIQTGWKMSGETAPPELNYHKETKLLIAFGEPDKLRTIDNVLRTLPSSNATRDELDNLRKSVRDLRSELDNLKAKAPPPAPTPSASPEEKSGK